MYRRILVPLDGSAFAEAAIPLAERTAGACGAELHLVRVHPVRAQPSPPPTGAGDRLREDEDDRLWEDERGYLSRLRASLMARGLAETRITVLKGEVADTLLTYARFQSIDLIVLATHGRGGLERAFQGSVADELVRRARTPVLLERIAEGAAGSEAVGCFDRILIPLDGSRLAEEAIRPALALGRPFRAQYTLLQVVRSVTVLASLPEPPRADRRLLAQFAMEARQYVEEVASGLRREDLSVSTRVEVGDEPAEAIARVAAEERAVVAMATHGRSGLSRLVMGSVADAVLRRATPPLLLFRPRERRPGHRPPRPHRA